MRDDDDGDDKDNEDDEDDDHRDYEDNEDNEDDEDDDHHYHDHRDCEALVGQLCDIMSIALYSTVMSNFTAMSEVMDTYSE